MFLQNLALFSLASLAATGGSVLLVDAVSGPFFDIQSAVDASTDGDVVLVRSGTYPAFSVVARDLAVVADSGATVLVQGAIRVRSLAADDTFVVSGLHSLGNPGLGPDRHGFVASFCAGSVRVQDCELRGSTTIVCAPYPSIGLPSGARIRDCEDVAFSRTLLMGSSSGGGYYGLYHFEPGGPGLDGAESRIAADRIMARGGTSNSCPDGSDGGTGAVAADVELFAQASVFQGSDGASNGQGPWGYGGHGGSGIFGTSACTQPTTTRLLACSLVAGSQGFGNCSIWPCPPGSFDGIPGVPSYVQGCANIVGLSGSVCLLDCASVVRENTALALAFTGTPGDRLWVRIARATGHAWDPARNGVRLVEAGLGRWFLAAELGASGQATYALPIPPLPVGQQARVFHLQVQAEHPDGSIQLGSARSVVIVDSAF